MSLKNPLRFTPAFRRRKLPTDADLTLIEPARMGQFQLSEQEVKEARRFIYAKNKEWMTTGVRYRTMHEPPFLYVTKFS
jgi:hypothetical protein